MIDRATRRHEELAEALENERRRAQTEAQRAQTEAQRAQTEAQRADRLAAKLRELGVDPDKLH